MPITALKSEAERKFIESVDEFDDRYINHVISKATQVFLLLYLKLRIFDQLSKFTKGFQLFSPVFYDNELSVFDWYRKMSCFDNRKNLLEGEPS